MGMRGRAVTSLSMKNRIIGTGIIVVPVFVFVLAAAIYQLFLERETANREERLLTQLYSVLGSIEEGEKGELYIDDVRLDPKFSTPDSGQFAAAVSLDTVLWQSGSLLDDALNFKIDGFGKPRFSKVNTIKGQSVFCGKIAVQWESGSNWVPIDVAVCERSDKLASNLDEVKFEVVYWLIGAGTIMLLAILASFIWSLAPLNVVTSRLSQVEKGQIESIDGPFPKELNHLTNSINALVQNERENLQRNRAAMDDLAHSLKTPIAVLKASESTFTGDEAKQLLVEQLGRMEQIVEHQLGRAVMANKQLYAKAVLVEPIAEKILTSLQKVYVQKDIELHKDINPKLSFQGAEDDLYEVLGNIIDNAFKHAVQQVKVTLAVHEKEVSEKHFNWYLKVEDDGLGIPLDKAEEVLKRGVRADTKKPGQGLGMGLVSEIVAMYQGDIEIGISRLGGASVIVRF